MTDALTTNSKSKPRSGRKGAIGRLFVLELSGGRIHSMNPDGSEADDPEAAVSQLSEQLGEMHDRFADALGVAQAALLASILHEDPQRLASLRDEVRELGVPVR